MVGVCNKMGRDNICWFCQDEYIVLEVDEIFLVRCEGFCFMNQSSEGKNKNQEPEYVGYRPDCRSSNFTFSVPLTTMIVWSGTQRPHCHRYLSSTVVILMIHYILFLWFYFYCHHVTFCLHVSNQLLPNNNTYIFGYVINCTT